MRELKKDGFYWLTYKGQKTIGKFNGVCFEIIGSELAYIIPDLIVGQEVEPEYYNDGK